MEDKKFVDITVSTYEYAMGDGFVPKDSNTLELDILTKKVEALAELLDVEFRVVLTKPSMW